MVNLNNSVKFAVQPNNITCKLVSCVYSRTSLLRFSGEENKDVFRRYVALKIAGRDGDKMKDTRNEGKFRVSLSSSSFSAVFSATLFSKQCAT